MQRKITEIQETFHRLALQWKQETAHYSQIKQIVCHPAYQQIIEMDEPVVPLIIQDLRQNGPNYWFDALRKITNENPVNEEDAGNLEKISQA